MTDPELFDTRGVKDDADHWDALAERIAREAARPSSRAGLIAASLLLAASLAFMTMTWRQASPRPAAELGQALAPSDDVGRAMASTGKPPAVAALLFDQPRQSGGQP
ncbi:MAG TPA: hypothetical protein VN706_18150 [Gemmatimonadaceae bacterium]|nr:hypothetical protein [Gemmatimonadaceae bacterium]